MRPSAKLDARVGARVGAAPAAQGRRQLADGADGRSAAPAVAVDEGTMKRIPLESIVRFDVKSMMRYEFRVRSSLRRQPWVFRVVSRAELDLWVGGLHALLGQRELERETAT